MHNLSDVEVVSRLAAEKALLNFKKEQKQKERKAILHNTEVLLKQYLELKYFYENCDHEGIVDDIETVVGTLRKDKATTKLLFSHVNKCLKRAKDKDINKFRVIELLYLDPQYEKWTLDNKINKAMLDYNISQTTAYRWRSDMISILSTMLFGADGLRIWTL